jgi:hypothetical protein
MSRTSRRAARKSAAARDQQRPAGRLAYCAIAHRGWREDRERWRSSLTFAGYIAYPSTNHQLNKYHLCSSHDQCLTDVYPRPPRQTAPAGQVPRGEPSSHAEVPPGDRRGWPFTWLFGLRWAGCRLHAPEAVADTGQVEGLALDRGGVVTSRKPGRVGSAGGDGVRQLVARPASGLPKLRTGRASGACLLAALASARRGGPRRRPGSGRRSPKPCSWRRSSALN